MTLNLEIMRTKHFDKILLLFLLLMASCEERYFPELDENYQNVLVIDGKITNAEPPYTVKLSLSTNVDTPHFIPVSDFEVEIRDELGNVAVLSEIDPGIYQTSPNDLQGVVGRSYQIVLHSPDGEYYESDFKKMKTPVGIESVNANLEYLPSEEYPYNIPGYQFYINTETAENDSTYFFWLLDETYQYESDYVIDFYYNGVVHEFPNKDSLKTCWYSGNVFPFYVESTTGMTEPRFTNYPLHFVSTKTRKISVRYSLLVNQYSINETTYEYWNGVKEQNASSGELYYTQPYQLRGNVYNTSNQDELVLGYFMVAGISQERIFVDKPAPPVLMLYPICELTANDYEDYGYMFLGGSPAEWPLYITTGPGGARALPNQSCIDCRKNGGTITKPDFWEE